MSCPVFTVSLYPENKSLSVVPGANPENEDVRVVINIFEVSNTTKITNTMRRSIFLCLFNQTKRDDCITPIW